MVDVRNLDAPEEQLIRATDVVIAAPAPGFPGEDLQQAVQDLAARCDLLYLHIDSDILDGATCRTTHRSSRTAPAWSRSWPPSTP